MLLGRSHCGLLLLVQGVDCGLSEEEEVVDVRLLVYVVQDQSSLLLFYHDDTLAQGFLGSGELAGLVLLPRHGERWYVGL